MRADMNNKKSDQLHEEGARFDLDEQDHEVIAIVTRFTEGILEMNANPKTRRRINQIVGLGRALKFLERLPDITPGASIEYGISLTSWEGHTSEKRYWEVEITGELLVVRSSMSTYDKAIGTDHIPGFHYEIRVDGYRNMIGNIYDWESEVEDALVGKIAVVDQCDEKLLSEVFSPAQIIKDMVNLGVINVDESIKALHSISAKKLK
jgi:hypothetical protein